VHAFELFQDPELVADRIAELLGAPVVERAVEEPAAVEPVVEPVVEPAVVDPADLAQGLAVDVEPTPGGSLSERGESKGASASAPSAAEPITEPIPLKDLALEETDSGFEAGPQRGWSLADDLDADRA